MVLGIACLQDFTSFSIPGLIYEWETRYYFVLGVLYKRRLLITKKGNARTIGRILKKAESNEHGNRGRYTELVQ